jgi:spermidine synthase
MRLQVMLGHLSALVHPRPRSVLVVGFGAGVTAGAFVLHPEVERLVICEIEPLIPKSVGPLFSAQNNDVLHDRRVEIVYDDARHYILTSREKFDIITSDPIHPWVKGAATLYSKEYFDLVKAHLNPGGVVTQWVPLYESDLNTVKSEMATFFDAFPNGTIWSNDIDGAGYDVVLLGQTGSNRIPVDEIQAEMLRPDHQRAARALAQVGLDTAVHLFGTYAGRASDLKTWLNRAEISRDRNMRLQYLAGLGLNYDRGKEIYDDLLRHRRFPEGLFVASDFRLAWLRRLTASPGLE